MLDQIKAHLLDSINNIVSTANQFLLHPKKDFSRKSQLTRNLDERAAFIDMIFIDMMKTSSFKQALVIMDRGYESYNVMAHCQERNWSYIIRIRDGNNSMKTSFRLPNTPCFDEEFDLKICRKQTNDMKELYRDFPNQYHFLPHNASFDFLPNSNRKSDPISFYDLHFRMVRLEIKPSFFETLVTNTDYSPEKLKDLYAYRWGIETSFRDLKYSIGLTHFHAKKKEGILQEIYARFINFNVCKWLTSHVAIKTSKLKQAYKICFSDAVYACRKFLRDKLTSFQLETYITKHLSIVRPNRTFQRKIKRKAPVSFTCRVT